MTWSFATIDLLAPSLSAPLQLLDQAAGALATSQPSPLVQFVPMILIFLVFYVIWFLPLKKKQKALDEVLANLTKGDKVVTNGGLYGKVIKAEGEIVVLELADNVRVRVTRRAIGGLEQESAANRGQ
ncbi:MAG: preprotein translocase subunit YajC [Acidobacteriota bacterium]